MNCLKLCNECVFYDFCSDSENLNDIEDCLEFTDFEMGELIDIEIRGEIYWGEMSWNKYNLNILEIEENRRYIINPYNK